MKSLFSRLGAGKAVAVVVAVIAVVAWWSWADMFRSRTLNFAHESAPFVGPLALVAVLVFVTWVAFDNAHVTNDRARGRYGDRYGTGGYDDPWGARSDEAKAAKAAAEVAAKRAAVVAARFKVAFITGVVATVAMVALIVTYWVTFSYQIDRQYVAAVKVVKDPAPTFAQRPAYDVAVASAKTNLGNVTGDLEGVRFVATAKADSWNALVVRKATFGGYAAVQEQHIGITGVSADPTVCSFNTAAADRRLSGTFNHSLERAIYSAASGVKIDGADAYGACLNGHATVIVPMTRVVGWLWPHEVPAGVSVYDGQTGKVTIMDEVKAGQLPGPVYPISLATKTREAAAALGSFADYWNNRVGYEDTNSDDGDPNKDNRAEFGMRQTDGGAAYVTPLTPRGHSVSIIAEGTLASDSARTGTLNAFTVHLLPKARIANGAAAQRIRGDYGDLPEWAAKMSVYEVAPSSPDEWVASLGQNQDIAYRVRIKADGASCLERADGTVLRCGKVTGTAGFGPGVALAPGTTAPTGVVAGADAELAKLTDAQIIALQERVAKEVAARLVKATPVAGK